MRLVNLHFCLKALDKLRGDAVLFALDGAAERGRNDVPYFVRNLEAGSGPTVAQVESSDAFFKSSLKKRGCFCVAPSSVKTPPGKNKSMFSQPACNEVFGREAVQTRFERLQ